MANVRLLKLGILLEMRNKAIVALVITLIGALCLASLSGYTLVLDLHNKQGGKVAASSEGDLVTVMEGLNLDEGVWEAYLLNSVDDLERLPPGVSRRTCLRLSDHEVLRKMKDEWKLRVTGGDMATITSAVVFVQNGSVRWQSGIDITDGEGLQSEAFGWAEPVEPGVLRRYAQYFKPVYSPIVILR